MGVPPPPRTPPNGPPKNQFFERLKLRVPVFYDISRYLTDKYFDIVWNATPPPGTPQMDPPKINFLNGSARLLLFFDISRYLTDKYFDIVWGCHPPREPPQMDSPKIKFWTSQARVPVFYDIRRYLTDKYILTLLFWRFPNQIFLNNCWFYGRQKVLLSVTALAMRRSFTGFAGKLPSSLVLRFYALNSRHFAFLDKMLFAPTSGTLYRFDCIHSNNWQAIVYLV